MRKELRDTQARGGYQQHGNPDWAGEYPHPSEGLLRRQQSNCWVVLLAGGVRDFVEKVPDEKILLWLTKSKTNDPMT